MRIALGVEYNGKEYFGWQSQVGGNTVQDTLEQALQVLAGHTVRVAAAGRTDAGVHALCQVVHFDTLTLRPLTAWVRGVNAHLPISVRVIWAKNVDDHFHARFDAVARSYQYVLLNQAVAPAIMAGRAGWFHLPLNVKSMQKAASLLLGEHDFSAFRAADCQAKSPIKTMHVASINQFGSRIEFNFTANAFLQHQVRNMVGALIYIGKGKYTPEYMLQLLNSRDRTISPPTFTPDGLYLVGVKYDDKWNVSESVSCIP